MKHNKVPIILLATGDPEGLSHHYAAADISETLAAETDEIDSAFEAAAFQSRVFVLKRQKATSRDITSAFGGIYGGCVTIFHFAGHADGQSIFLKEEDGNVPVLHASNLAMFLEQQQNLRLVFLNACNTQEHLRALQRAKIPAIVATTEEIDDDAARKFAVDFYNALAEGSSIRNAYNTAIFHANCEDPERKEQPWQLMTASPEVDHWRLWPHILWLPVYEDAELSDRFSMGLNASQSALRIRPKPAVPFPPQDTTRANEVAKIVQVILDLKPMGVVLHGAVNIGKTVLARRILHDRRIADPVIGYPHRFEISLQVEDGSAAMLRKLLSHCRYGSGASIDVEKISDRELLGLFAEAIEGDRCVVFFRNVQAAHCEAIAELQRELPNLVVLATAPQQAVATHLRQHLHYACFEVRELDEDDAITLLDEAASHQEGRTAPRDPAEHRRLREVVRVLDRKPKLLKAVGAMGLKPYELAGQGDWGRLRSSLVETTLSQNDRDLLASIVAQLTPHQQEEFCRLSVFAPAPATLCPSTEQIVWFVPLGALVRIDYKRYQIADEYHTYAEKLAPVLLGTERCDRMRDEHAREYAQAAARAYRNGLQGIDDFDDFHSDWANVKAGWQCAFERLKQEPLLPCGQGILLQYASCLFFFDPFTREPEEKVTRIRAALPSSTFDADQIDIGHIWICLARAHLDLANKHLADGKVAAARGSVRQAKEILTALSPVFQDDSVAKCAISILLGDIHAGTVHKVHKKAYRLSSDEVTVEEIAKAETESERCYEVGHYLARKYGLRRYECLAEYGIAGLKVTQRRFRSAAGGYIRALHLAAGIRDDQLQKSVLLRLGETVDLLLQEAERTNRQEPDAPRLQQLTVECKALATKLDYAADW